VDGVGQFVSSVVVGFLWAVTAMACAFAYAALLSIAGAMVLLPGLREGC